MIESIYQIDFITTSGGTTRLLDYGDLISAMINFAATQQATANISLGLPWGGTIAAGGARRPLTWTRNIEHSSHAEAAGYSIRHPAAIPITRDGKLRVSVSGGETWDLFDAVILNVQVANDAEGDFTTLATYQAEAGRSLPVSGLAHFSGIPTAWLLTTHTAQTLDTQDV